MWNKLTWVFSYDKDNLQNSYEQPSAAHFEVQNSRQDLTPFVI